MSHIADPALHRAVVEAKNDLSKGVAAKGPAEILVQCNKDGGRNRAAVEEKLAAVERLAAR